MNRVEKLLLGAFTVLFLASTTLLLRRFYLENTELVPQRGGTYIEGSVGTIRMLNPWFTVTNDVNRDITSLVFSGLQRYNPFTGKIEDDMAQLTLSGGNRIYTLKLREGIFWHDSTLEQPRPVTADDVVFTYQTVKAQGFPSPILQKNFRGVEIEKIDDRTVQFRLERPYTFFRSNLTLGIVPAHRLTGIPPDRLTEALDFNLSPIGSGPYKWRSVAGTELATEVTLEHSPGYYGATSYIDRIVFRAFPDYPSLLSDLRNLDGVRHVPRNKLGHAIIPQRYNTFYYSLPQYVALFFNLDRPILKDQKLRLGLQLAVDKRAIVDAVNERVIVDTPLLEFAQGTWQYQFQPSAAQGALFDSAWHLPEKLRLQHLLEVRDSNATGALLLPQPIVLLETGASLTFTGSSLDLPVPLAVNGIPVQPLEGTSSGTWIVTLPTDGNSGSILIGENFLKLTGTGGVAIDTFVLTRVAERAPLTRLREEQNMVERYREEEGEAINIADLRMEEGVLRLKKEGEPQSVRQGKDGEALHLRLLTSILPPTYRVVAELVREQWRVVGVESTVEIPDDRKAFEDRVIHRDYDVLLFGQPLLDNLDSYPYWHSSQIQMTRGEEEENTWKLDANNLSQYASFKADTLLEQIRETHDGKTREKALEALRELFREDIPAIVLYSPTYVFAVSEKIFGVDLGKPSLHSDRFLSMHRWFIKQSRDLKAGKSWWNFPSWLLTLWRG